VAVILYTKLQCPHYSVKSHILRESQRYSIIPVGSLDYKIFNPKFRHWENQFRIAIRICNHVCVCVYLSKCTYYLCFNSYFSWQIWVSWYNRYSKFTKSTTVNFTILALLVEKQPNSEKASQKEKCELGWHLKCQKT